MNKRFLPIMIAALLLVMQLFTYYSIVNSIGDMSSEHNNTLYYFYIYGLYSCSHCRAMKETLIKNYGEEHVYFCSLDNEGENRTRFIELVNKGFPESVPLTFIVYNYTVSAVIIGEYSNIDFINNLLRTNRENKAPIYTVAATETILYKYLVIEGSHRDFILKYLYWEKYFEQVDRDSINIDFKLASPLVDSKTLLLATLPALIVYGLLDSINPCVIIMYFSLVASSLTGKKSIGPPILFLIIIYIGYLIFALGLLMLTKIIPGKLLILLAFIMGVYTIFRAGREKTPSFKCTWCEKISFVHKFMSNKYIFSLILALVSVIVLLPCTSGPLSGFIGLLRNYLEDPGEALFVAVPVFLLYNVLFILPLIIIFILMFFMGREKRIANWLKENGPVVEFLIGIVLAMFSLILLLST